MPREQATEYFSGQGILYLAENLNEVPQGYLDVGNAPELSIAHEVSKFEKKESRSGSRLLAFSQITEKKGNITITCDSWHTDNLKKLLQAAVTEKAAGAVTGDIITARLGKVVPLSNMKVSAVIVKNEAGSTTYVLDDNYTVNTETGTIYFMTDAEQTAASAVASIAEGDGIIVTYTRAAQDEIATFGEAEQEYSLMFEGLNTARDNEPVLVLAHRVKISPAKTLALINDETGTLQIEGQILATTIGSKYVTIRKL